MTWFHNLRIAPKLIGSFLLLAILTATVATAGYVETQNLPVVALASMSLPDAVLADRAAQKVEASGTPGAVQGEDPRQALLPKGGLQRAGPCELHQRLVAGTAAHNHGITSLTWPVVRHAA